MADRRPTMGSSMATTGWGSGVELKNGGSLSFALDSWMLQSSTAIWVLGLSDVMSALPVAYSIQAESRGTESSHQHLVDIDQRRSFRSQSLTLCLPAILAYEKAIVIAE
jgi:hypothetical protein